MTRIKKEYKTQSDYTKEWIKKIKNKKIQKTVRKQFLELDKIPNDKDENNKRAKGGKRADLGDRYFRSAWEANIARFFNYQNIKWEYEVKEFIFPGVKRGNISYKPDFYLPDTKEWVEVKGWMDDKSRVKLERFEKYFPEEAARLILIDQQQYKQIEKLYSRIIEFWE